MSLGNFSVSPCRARNCVAGKNWLSGGREFYPLFSESLMKQWNFEAKQPKLGLGWSVRLSRNCACSNWPQKVHLRFCNHSTQSEIVSKIVWNDILILIAQFRRNVQQFCYSFLNFTFSIFSESFAILQHALRFLCRFSLVLSAGVAESPRDRDSQCGYDREPGREHTLRK